MTGALSSDLPTFRFVAALGFALGAIGGVALWMAAPETIHSAAVATATTAGCVVMTVVALVTPWDRRRSWMLLPAMAGTAIVAVAIWNMDDGRETYGGFYLYIALAAAYFLSRTELLAIVTAIALASAAPLLYGDDPLVESTVNWLYTCAGAGVVALVLSNARQRLHHHATTSETAALVDQLTGIMNRRGFEQRGHAALARAAGSGGTVALLYLDLDGFKLVNDYQGHATGDRVLRRVALAMSTSIRGANDALARVGGDEFIVLLDGSERAADVAGRLVRAVESVAADEPACAHLSASVGYSVFPVDGHGLEALMHAADERLRAAKQERRARRGAAGVV